MQEFTALIGLRHRFGTPWRPIEQGAVERVHQTAQQMLGVLVHDVLQMSPEHWTEALPVVEFIIYNTPRASWVHAQGYRSALESCDPFGEGVAAFPGAGL